MKRRTVKDRRPWIHFDGHAWLVQVGKFSDTFKDFIGAARFARTMWDAGCPNNWQRGRYLAPRVFPFIPRSKQVPIVHMVDLTSIDQIVIEAIADKRKFLFKADPVGKVASVEAYIEEITAPPPPPPKLSFVTRLASLEADMARPPIGVFVIGSITSSCGGTE
jgi:hypothetical protein